VRSTKWQYFSTWLYNVCNVNGNCAAGQQCMLLFLLLLVLSVNPITYIHTDTHTHTHPHATHSVRACACLIWIVCGNDNNNNNYRHTTNTTTTSSPILSISIVRPFVSLFVRLSVCLATLFINCQSAHPSPNKHNNTHTHSMSSNCFDKAQKPTLCFICILF